MYLIGKSVGRGHELRSGWLLARRQESQRVLDLFCCKNIFSKNIIDR